jgi:hypothetical protein
MLRDNDLPVLTSVVSAAARLAMSGGARVTFVIGNRSGKRQPGQYAIDARRRRASEK